MTTAEDPRTAPTLRWGVLAPGGIAHTFAKAVLGHTEGRIVAVGSRSLDRAEQFAREYDVPTAHGTYEDLVADPDVEAVYVASPHSEHRDHALLAIAAGKHVLVEKSFTRNAAEAQEVVDAARAAGVFCMEAMWTRFLPHVVELRAALERGEIGEVVSVLADHGQAFGHLPSTHRLHDPRLAGGALLDLGVYPVSFAHHLLGAPDRVQALGSLTPTGVDGQISIALGYGERVQASLHTTLWSRTATTAVIGGTEGRIEVASDFYRPTTFTVVRADGERRTVEGLVDGGFQYQAAEVARRVAEGATESPLMTWDMTLDVMRTMDEVRRQVGVAYPGE
ncbi:Gfo/Idh/MocA family protein [Cellulomonas carbonis]|uniref:Oxidoreductase n=1 Tax=Cellulomonas carbonis T26 TaxID=947969 RepID=A0A0A0BT78_9CELL|nr:Gfo/Idh/MocA family oxidoreductase [Cellulomonas carbonis]KGM10354.1 oxidoreductase [Cellulomonas carbonis T26]GGC04466.1 oxidoreductase [Cellulomonas carbonis]